MIHVYTGNGKGKTSAAIGLAIRACGWQKSVLLAQFFKGKSFQSGEIKAIGSTKLKIKVLRFIDQVHPIFLPKDKKFSYKFAKLSIEKGLVDIEKEAKKRKYDIIILDEILNPLKVKLLSIKRLKEFIAKNSKKEIVLTGRYLTKEIIKIADYVSLIKKIKHPFDKGITARKGIEF